MEFRSRAQEQRPARNVVNTLLWKAIERKVLLNKVKYSRRFLYAYLSVLSALILLSLSIMGPIALVLAVVVLIFLAVPHDKHGPQRYNINPDETFIPVLCPWYRKKLREVEKYIKYYLPLLPEEQRRYVEMAMGG